MPTINVNGANIHYEEHGSGPTTIVFAHGLLWSGRMFDNQVNALKDRYRCITFDFRGQGQSQVTASGYDMDTLAQDAAALIEALHCAPCHFVGLSMGGMVAMRLALRRPKLLRSILLLETSADAEPPENFGRFRLLNFIARWIGLRVVAGQVMQVMFGQKFLTDAKRAALKQEWQERMVSNHRIGVTRAVAGVINRAGVADEIHKIALPTLIIVGDQDVATVPAKAEKIHAKIAGSQLVIIPGAGHTATVEEPEAINRAILAFLRD